MATYNTTGLDLDFPLSEIDHANPTYFQHPEIYSNKAVDLSFPLSQFDSAISIYLNKVRLYGSLGNDLPFPFSRLDSATATYLESRKFYGSKGIELPSLKKIIYSPTEHTTEILYWSDLPSFPGNMQMTEIIYPVVPISEQNKVLSQVDSMEWRVTTKASAPKNWETDVVRFRVDTSYIATFMNDLHSNKLNQFRLTTLGYTPFGGTSQDNYVRVLSHSRPQREDRGQTQLIDVEFLWVANYP